MGRFLVREPGSRIGALLAGWAVVACVGLVPILNVAWWSLGAVFGLGAMTVAAWRARGSGRHRVGAAPPRRGPDLSVASFLLLGSGEFEPWTHDVEAAVFAGASGDGSVVVLPTASSTEGDAVFDRWGAMGLAHFAEAGIPAEFLPVKRREDALDPGIVARVGRASVVYFSGGKPSHLAEVLHDTPLLAAIARAMERGAVWTGCSAGAMVVSSARTGGTTGRSWRSGLGLVPNVAFGVHWDRVAKVPGAAWWMSSRLPDGTWFVGIDERTAIAGDGTSWEVWGSGAAHVRRGDDRDTFAAGRRFATP